MKKNKAALEFQGLRVVTTDCSVKTDVMVDLTEKLALKQDLKEMKALARLANFCVRAFQAEEKNKCKIVSS